MAELNDLTPLIAQAAANTVRYIDPAFPDQPLWLHAARPAAFGPQTPVLFVHHGVGRNGRAYRDYWLDAAERDGLLVVAIEFTEAAFPEYLWYHFGNLHARDGTPEPRERWTFGIDERLFDALRAQGVTARDGYGVFGHSAGGQFVHRMLSFGYRDRVEVAVSANAGTYAMPDLRTPWPFGLGELGLDESALRDVLMFPLMVMAGTEDTKTSGRFFPRGPRSMRQGAHRYERAHNYVRAGHEAARALGVGCRWCVIDVPGVGHDGASMSKAAAPVLAAAMKGRRADLAGPDGTV